MVINMKEIYLAAGCFWGSEKYLASVRGVLATDVGYANGDSDQTCYEAVCTGSTGHAETVRVAYDEEQLPLEALLNMYYRVIDPTSLNRQGNDVGTQYRTGIYYSDPADQKIIQSSIRQLSRALQQPLAIEVKPLENYCRAEDCHQKYLDKNPGGYCHISPAAIAQAAQLDPVAELQGVQRKS